MDIACLLKYTGPRRDVYDLPSSNTHLVECNQMTNMEGLV